MYYLNHVGLHLFFFLSFFFFFFFGSTVQHVKLSWPGIKPIAHVVEAQNLNHWTAREVLSLSFFWDDGIQAVLKWYQNHQFTC